MGCEEPLLLVVRRWKLPGLDQGTVVGGQRRGGLRKSCNEGTGYSISTLTSVCFWRQRAMECCNYWWLYYGIPITNNRDYRMSEWVRLRTSHKKLHAGTHYEPHVTLDGTNKDESDLISNSVVSVYMLFIHSISLLPWVIYSYLLASFTLAITHSYIPIHTKWRRKTKTKSNNFANIQGHSEANLDRWEHITENQIIANIGHSYVSVCVRYGQ